MGRGPGLLGANARRRQLTLARALCTRALRGSVRSALARASIQPPLGAKPHAKLERLGLPVSEQKGLDTQAWAMLNEQQRSAATYLGYTEDGWNSELDESAIAAVAPAAAPAAAAAAPAPDGDGVEDVESSAAVEEELRQAQIEQEMIQQQMQAAARAQMQAQAQMMQAQQQQQQQQFMQQQFMQQQMQQQMQMQQIFEQQAPPG